MVLQSRMLRKFDQMSVAVYIYFFRAGGTTGKRGFSRARLILQVRCNRIAPVFLARSGGRAASFGGRMLDYRLPGSDLQLLSIVRKNDAGASFEVLPRRVLGGFRFNGIPPRLFPIPRFLTTDETRLRKVCDLLVSRS